MKSRTEKKWILVFLILFVLCMMYITLFSRSQSFLRTLSLNLFHTHRLWLTGNWTRGKSVLQNIALFLPFGYLVCDAFSYGTKGGEKSGKRWRTAGFTILVGLLFSLLIEVIQYFTGRGTADVDDLVNNTIGAGIGAGLFFLAERIPGWTRITRILFPVLILFSGVTGSWMMSEMVQNDIRAAQQFDFSVTSVTSAENLSFSGQCEVYDRATPEYSILLRSGSSMVTADTEISGKGYTATARVEPNRQYEVLVKFSGFGALSSGTYLRDAEVAYVPGDVPDPDGAEMKDAVLKAYSEEYDTYVYVKDGELLWLIGYEIEDTTEIIYHIYTNEPERLPEHRIQYGFDNRGFRAPANETEPIGHYRVFKKALPTEYNITAVTVGFNPGGKVVWSQGFRVEQSL